MSKTAVNKTQAADLSHIVEALRPLAVEITKLSFDEKNAMNHSDRNIATIQTSLAEFGQRIPIIVQKKGMIVRAGNGRLQAAKNLGWTHIAAVVTDDADATAKAFALMDNKSSDLSEWNFDRLAEILKDLNSAEMDISLTGFNDIEFEDIMELSLPPSLETDGEHIQSNVDTLSLKGSTKVINDIREIIDKKREIMGNLLNRPASSITQTEALHKLLTEKKR